MVFKFKNLKLNYFLLKKSRKSKQKKRKLKWKVKKLRYTQLLRVVYKTNLDKSFFTKFILF